MFGSGPAKGLIKVDAVLASKLIRDLAASVEDSKVEITSIENNVWDTLHKGTLTIHWTW